MVAMLKSPRGKYDTLTVDEYVEFVETSVDVLDYDSVVEGSWALRALANNRDFVLDNYHDELKTYWSGTSDNETMAQSVKLSIKKDFYVRTNIWLPMRNRGVLENFERALYSYDMPHDHNFHLLTVGYYGPGYETDLYSYDSAKVIGYEGESVELASHGRHQLGPGDTWVYKSCSDIHVQLPPVDVSISLNLMCRPANPGMTPQYIFDVARGEIHKGAGDVVSTRFFILDLCKHLNNEDTIDILSRIATDHRCVRTRSRALQILREIRPEDTPYFEGKVDRPALELSRYLLASGSGTRDFAVT